MPRTDQRQGDSEPDSVPESGAAPEDGLARHDKFVKNQAKKKLGLARIGIASASDIAQDAWVATLEANRRGKGPPNSPPAEAKFLWTTLVNRIRLAFRNTKTEKSGAGATFVPIEPGEVPDSGTTPSSKVARLSREECLEKAMRSLDARDQEVLTLTFVEGKSRKEIAARIGVGERQAGNVYRDALERLRMAYVALGGPWDFS